MFCCISFLAAYCYSRKRIVFLQENRFEGIFNICYGYGPNFHGEGKCYDENGNLYYEGDIQCNVGGVGYRTVRVPGEYGPIVQGDKPDIQFFLWEDEK